MSDIFISYASEDRPTAKDLAEALERCGWSVWWDRRIPTGKYYAEVIEAELTAARCVIVIWSENSVKSSWVKTEAADARERGLLFPTLIDQVRIPLEFRSIQTADLVGWDKEKSSAGFDTLVADLTTLLGRPSEAAAAPDSARTGEGAPRRPSAEADAPVAVPAAPPARDAGDEPNLGSDAPVGGAVQSKGVGAARREPDGAGLRTRPGKFMKSPRAWAAAGVVIVLGVSLYVISQRRGPVGNTNNRQLPGNSANLSTPNLPANQNALNQNTAVADVESDPERARRLASLLKQLNADQPRARRAATDSLTNEYADSPQAVAQALALLDERGVNELSPQGLVNVLFFLNKTNTRAWSKESFEQAREAIRVVEARSPARDAAAELTKLKARISRMGIVW